MWPHFFIRCSTGSQGQPCRETSSVGNSPALHAMASRNHFVIVAEISYGHAPEQSQHPRFSLSPFIATCYRELRAPAAAGISTSGDILKIKSLGAHSSDPRPRSAEIPGYTSVTVPAMSLPPLSDQRPLLPAEGHHRPLPPPEGYQRPLFRRGTTGGLEASFF